MALDLDPNAPLPRFRLDLGLYRGPDDADGSPTYNIFDPLKGQYYKITWEQFLIIQNMRTGMTLNDLYNELNLRATIKITRDDIKIFFEDALKYNLLDIHKTPEQVSKEASLSKIGLFKSILYRYLYFRIPIIKPDDFLSKTLPYVLPFASPIALGIYFILTVLGIVLLIGRFEEYVHTFTYFFNFNGIIAYLIGIWLVKFLHEFSHAYTANYYKIHIPSMGVAVIVFWPVLYTDVTDGWKLSKRSDRMAISAAGITAEIILAGICTLGWALSQPGIMQSIFFVISSVTWVSSLIVNINPAMRFDGYYLLSDWWGIDNLQPRAFAVTRWWLRKFLFGLDLPCPEERIDKRMITSLVLYTLYTWAYRVVLYTAIAFFVYFVFTKVLGIFLFISEIVIFIIWPIASEIKELTGLKTYFERNPNLIITISVTSLILLWLILPLPHTEIFTAVAVPTEEYDVYIPEDAKIDDIFVKRGDHVKKGQPLLTLSSKKLNTNIDDFSVRKQILEKEIDVLGLKAEERQFLAEKKRELEAVDNALSRYQYQKDELDIKSDIDGQLISWNEELHKSQYVYKNMLIGKVAQNSFKVIGFVPESLRSTVSNDQKAAFVSYRSHNKYKGKIARISPVRASYLNYPALASTNHGVLPVSEVTSENNVENLKLVESFFPLEVALNNPDVSLHYGEIGAVEVSGPWRSYLGSFIKYLLRIFWQESGF